MAAKDNHNSVSSVRITGRCPQQPDLFRKGSVCLFSRDLAYVQPGEINRFCIDGIETEPLLKQVHQFRFLLCVFWIYKIDQDRT